ncbi:MAG: S1C family serine protease, partial [Rhizobiaceae bacterium]
MGFSRIISILIFVGTSLVLSSRLAYPLPRDALSSVVSVLPIWPDNNQRGTARPTDIKPEGSGVVLRDGVVATAWHVIERAETIEVRLNDGRVLPAKFIAKDVASDIALISVVTDLKPIEIAPEPQLAEPVCAIGNAYGFGLSVTCGVVSAVSVTNAGFNPVEDFVQTDAAINPGMSGGALVDKNGHLTGMISAIFSSKSDTNIGVNFAVSVPLLLSVANDLIEQGAVRYPKPGWRLNMATRAQLQNMAAPIVDVVLDGSPASRAGVEAGDRIIKIGKRHVRTPNDAIAALAIVPADQQNVEVSLQRDGQAVTVSLPLDSEEVESVAAATQDVEDCGYPAPVCLLRQAVFPVSSYDPVASGTRIGPNLIVTNRHVVGDRKDAIVHTPDGPRNAKVIPSAYSGDLVLLEVDGLPEAGFIPDIGNSVLE